MAAMKRATVICVAIGGAALLAAGANAASIDESYDTDGSGTLSRAEFHAGVFRDLDEDGDGSLSEGEMVAAPDFFDFTFALADENADLVVDPGELSRALTGRKVFESLDANRDESLEETEVAAFFGRFKRRRKGGF